MTGPAVQSTFHYYVTYLWQEECLSQRLRGTRMTQLEKAT